MTVLAGDPGPGSPYSVRDWPVQLPFLLQALKTATLSGSATATSFTLTFPYFGPTFNFTFTGTGFGAPDAGGIPTTGTVTGYTMRDTANQLAEAVTNASVPLATLRSIINSVDGTALSGALYGGNDTMSGSSDIDYLWGYAGDDMLQGLAGFDTLEGGLGNDTLDGGADGDRASYTSAAAGVTVSLAVAGPQNTGGAGVDTLISIEAIEGSAFADQLTGDGGDNGLLGGAGADVLDGGAGNDNIRGEAGDDIVYVDSVGDDVAEFPGEGTDTIRTTLSSYVLGLYFENLTYLGAGAFQGTGNGENNVIVGGTGVNTLSGMAGNDTLIGSAAGGSLDGGDGADVLWFYGATALQGGNGSQDYAIQVDQSAQTRSLATIGVEIYVGAGGADTLDSIGATAATIIYGGAGNDTVTLGNAGGFIFGQAGADTLNGGAGGDTLIGNAGADAFNAGGGNDVMYVDAADGQNFDGGAGIDYAIVEGGGGAVSVNLATRNVEVFIGNTGADTIDASGVAYAMGLYGFDGADTINGPSSSSQLFGQDGNDILNAGAINDVVLGGAGLDQLFGNAGDDLLIGEAGDDLLVGGTGADVLWGDVNGTGNDTFRFATADAQAGVRDQINDFGDAAGNQDVIQFSGIAQNQVTVADDGAGNALLTIAASGGTYSILVIGMSAAAIQDDLVFGP